MFAPQPVFAQVPTVIAEEYDVGAVREFRTVERVENFADLCIDETD